MVYEHISPKPAGHSMCSVVPGYAQLYLESRSYVHTNRNPPPPPPPPRTTPRMRIHVLVSTTTSPFISSINFWPSRYSPTSCSYYMLFFGFHPRCLPLLVSIFNITCHWVFFLFLVVFIFLFLILRLPI